MRRSCTGRKAGLERSDDPSGIMVALGLTGSQRRNPRSHDQVGRICMARITRPRRPKMTKARIAAVTVGTIGLAVGGMAVAQAAVPGSGGVITACYGKNGSLRIIDTAKTKCARGETALSWNQKGPQ